MLTSENLSEGNAQSDMDISIFVPPATSVTQEGTSRQNGKLNEIKSHLMRVRDNKNLMLR